MTTFLMQEPCTLSTEKLEQEIGELAAHIQAATCRWLLLVAELDRREGWAAWGARSCADWLSWHCGLSPGAAREQVRVARRLGEMPLAREAFGRGELSYSKARAISRIVTAENEAELVQLALHSTAAQLERVVSGYRGSTADLDEANGAHERRYASLTWEEDGSLSLRARLPAEDGALLIRAIDAARDSLWAAAEPPEDVSAETPASAAERGGRPSNADALAAVAEASLAAGGRARCGGERYQIVVHADSAVLRGEGDGRSEVENGPSLPAETVRRLACDASVVPIAEREGGPLTVGRKTRTVPPALRRALQSRDEGCCFPGCGQRRLVDAHHVRHWAKGGETKLSNLLLLCRRHHRLVHEDGYGVEVRRGRHCVFRRPDGRAIPAAPPPRRGNTDRLRDCHRRAGIAIAPGTGAARSAGDRLDLGMAVEGLLARDGLLAWPAPSERPRGGG